MRLRIIKLNTVEEFPNRVKAREFFLRDLPARSPRGAFYITRRAIAANGLAANDRLVFTHKGECIFVADAKTGRLPNKDRSDKKYPYYFIVNLETLWPVQGMLRDLQRILKANGAQTSNLHRSRSWPSLTLDVDANRLVDSFLFNGNSLESRPDAGDAEDFLRQHAIGQGFMPNKLARAAIEQQAMNEAIKYFQSLGFQCTDCSRHRSYDLHCVKNGQELLVEVKGTTGNGQTIILTAGEVKLSRLRASKMCLFVLHSVKIAYGRGTAKAAGGIRRIIRPWLPADDQLSALAFTCNLRRGMKRGRT